jgi:hypothetical protein
MQIKIIDEDTNYEVDTIQLDDYDIENDSESLIEVIIEILEAYQEEREQDIEDE